MDEAGREIAMTPSGPPKKGKGLLIIAGKPGADDDDGPGPLAPPDGDEPDADDEKGEDSSGQSCATCYAFAPSSGRCQMFPPHPADWSMVDASDWCCQWKAGKQHDDQGAAPESMPPAPGAPPPQGGQPLS